MKLELMEHNVYVYSSQRQNTAKIQTDSLEIRLSYQSKPQMEKVRNDRCVRKLCWNYTKKILNEGKFKYALSK